MEEAFKAYDTDNSGTITLDEVRDFFKNARQEDEEVWTRIIGEADANSDGVIDLKEFK